MVYFFQLYHSTRTVGFNFLFHFFPCYFLTYFPDFYEIGSVTECGRSLSSLGNQHRTGLYTCFGAEEVSVPSFHPSTSLPITPLALTPKLTIELHPW